MSEDTQPAGEVQAETPVDDGLMPMRIGGLARTLGDFAVHHGMESVMYAVRLAILEAVELREAKEGREMPDMDATNYLSNLRWLLGHIEYGNESIQYLLNPEEERSELPEVAK